MACSKIGFGVVEKCVNLISLTSLLTLLCRIKRNISESVGGNSGSRTEGGDPHLGSFIFFNGYNNSKTGGQLLQLLQR
jgi:hypothetical protein